MKSALAMFVRVVQTTNVWVGKTASWLYPVLMLVIVVNVVLRYGFSLGSIMLEELQWHLYSVGFLLCLAYAYVDDAHVRVDVLYLQLSVRKQMWIDFLGCVFLLIPFAGFLTWDAWPYFLDSLAFNERSPVPSGLPARYVIKLVLFIGLLLLLLQGIATALKKLLQLAGYERV